MSALALPQLRNRCLTDAGLETDILFNRGIDLPHFSSITLFRSEEGKAALLDYYRGFLDLAERKQIGFILESATWRASPDWAAPLGLTLEELDKLVVEAIEMLLRLKAEYEERVPGLLVSGCVGPRGDGYDPGSVMQASDAQDYHAHQIGVMKEAGCRIISAITMTNVPEAIGVVRAARDVELPVTISFTLETDGTLPTGQKLEHALADVDQSTGEYATYFMVNCAHPDHFMPALERAGDKAISRIKGVRANASRCSHAELDAMTQLDRGDPAELASLHRTMLDRYPGIRVIGGCCGTDLEHISAIADACLFE